MVKLTTRIFQTSLVTSKAIVANAAKMWKEHKEAEDSTHTKYQTMYEKQRFKEAASQSNENSSDEAGPADIETESVASSKGGGKKTKSKRKLPPSQRLKVSLNLHKTMMVKMKVKPR